MAGRVAVWTMLDDWHPECELTTRRRPYPRADGDFQ
jgi:hypothetical protein